MAALDRLAQWPTEVARALTRRFRSDAILPVTLTASERWQLGHEAFDRGESPPSDPDEAEGWYWAENRAAMR
jgi:hypothetical protein